MSIQPINTPYNFSYNAYKVRIKLAFQALNNIRFDNEKEQNLKHIKRMIVHLFPVLRKRNQKRRML